jgi:hypothetical protein
MTETTPLFPKSIFPNGLCQTQSHGSTARLLVLVFNEVLETFPLAHLVHGSDI